MALKELIASMDNMNVVQLLIARELIDQVIRYGDIKRRVVAIKKESLTGVLMHKTLYFDYYVTYGDKDQKIHQRVTMTEEGAKYLAEAYGIPIVEPVS